VSVAKEIEYKSVKLADFALKGVTLGKYGVEMVRFTEFLPAGFDEPNVLQHLGDNRHVKLKEKVSLRITKDSD